MKPKILTFIKHYLPGYKFGGPVRTIANMVDRMGDGFDFKILTQDCDYTETRPYPDIKSNEWNQVGRAQVYYCSRSKMNLLFLTKILQETNYDLLYLNSFFDPHFTVMPLLLRLFKAIPDVPVVLAPRGEFSPGALRIKSYKKKPFCWIVKKLCLYKNITWQASTKYEAEDIKMVMGSVAKSVVNAVNLSPAAAVINAGDKCKWPVKSPNCLKAVFLSRISDKKNLDYALNVLKNVKANVCFDIYGTSENADYWNVCKQIIETMPSNIKVKYHGELPHENIHSVLRNYALFLFPTRGENFGHVIMEALTAGLPILISDQTPWRELASKGVGWDLPLDHPAEFVKKIEEVSVMDTVAHKDMRTHVWNYSQEVCKDDSALAANKALFTSVLRSGE